ncbi:GD23766 [Drosophila simulans]|uniref:GD23766 n=1 Tax=Drosophila simulans TaxID=7240 RepID=B4NVX9_DROSI|nr:GD23766 [Drosophila simulans]
MASTTGQKFAVHGRHNISWQDMPAPSFYSISSESGSGSGDGDGDGDQGNVAKRREQISQTI